MDEALLISVADTIQLLTILLTILGFLHQLITLYVTKDSTGLSRDAWIVWALGSAMALFYALVHYWIEGCCLPLVVTTAFNCALSFGTLVLIVLYREPPLAEGLQPRPHPDLGRPSEAVSGLERARASVATAGVCPDGTQPRHVSWD